MDNSQLEWWKGREAEKEALVVGIIVPYQVDLA